MDIPNGKIDQPDILVGGEVRMLRLVRSTDQWHNCPHWGKSILCLRTPVCRIDLRIHSITLRVYVPGRSIAHVVSIWALAKMAPHTIYLVSKIEKPLTVWCGDGGCSPFWQLVIHRIDLIVHHPSGAVGNVLGNLASAFVEVAINLWLGIAGFKESDGLCEIFGTVTGLPLVADEISELIVIRIVNEGCPSHGIYLDFKIFIMHWSFPRVSLLLISFLGRRIEVWEVLAEAILLGVRCLWNLDNCMGWNGCIGFRGFYKTLPMRRVQSSMRWVALWISRCRRQLSLMAESQMVFKVSLRDKHPNAVRIWAFEWV